MNYYKAIVQYDGTNYFGFQWQKDLRTIQDDFNKSMGQLLSGKITTMSASRTDTGVHALDQIVKITSEHPIECTPFLLELNRSLPDAIRCLTLEECEASYKPSTDNFSKEYRYFFTNKLKSSSFNQKFIVNHPYELDISLMKICSEMIVGRHDFKNFCSAGSNVKSTVREILLCEISEVDPRSILPQSGIFELPADLERCYQLRIEGKGFLKQMVRHLMRALWLVGAGKITPDEFRLLIDGPIKTKRLWKVAAPNGLFLYRILTRN